MSLTDVATAVGGLATAVVAVLTFLGGTRFVPARRHFVEVIRRNSTELDNLLNKLHPKLGIWVGLGVGSVVLLAVGFGLPLVAGPPARGLAVRIAFVLEYPALVIIGLFAFWRPGVYTVLGKRRSHRLDPRQESSLYARADLAHLEIEIVEATLVFGLMVVVSIVTYELQAPIAVLLSAYSTRGGVIDLAVMGILLLALLSVAGFATLTITRNVLVGNLEELQIHVRAYTPQSDSKSPGYVAGLVLGVADTLRLRRWDRWVAELEWGALTRMEIGSVHTREPSSDASQFLLRPDT